MVEDAAYQRRLRALEIIIAVAFAALFGRLWQLQVAQGAQYLARSQSNTEKQLRVPAPRGLLVDRNGQLLAGNEAFYQACVLPARVGERSERIMAAHDLAQLLGVPYDRIREAVEAKAAPPYQPVVVKGELTPEEIQKVEENAVRMPGVFVRQAIRRYYPGGALAAHVMGYVGEVSPEELEQAKKQGGKLRAGQIVGKEGVEKFYDGLLRGQEGTMDLVVDAKGRLLETSENARVIQELQGLQRELEGGSQATQAPQPGAKLWLSIDARLQRAVEEAMAGKTGAAVVMDCRTGEILALASSPSFNPASLSGQVSAVEMQRLTADTRRPFLERAHMGHYPPGSTFKMVTFLAALQSGAVSPSDTVYCTGTYKVGARTARCWKSGGHGLVGPVRAIAESCDVYFFDAGLKAGIDAIKDTARKMGLETETGVDLPSEVPSLVPGPLWKERKYHERWYAGDTVNSAIGQGFILLTPLGLARATGLVATEGQEVVPHALRKVEAEKPSVTEARAKARGRAEIDARWFALLKQGMRGAVEWQSGTGHAARLAGVSMGAKTGTAQTTSDMPEHAWFTCFAPVEQPQVVCTVLVEHGGMGGAAAAPVARQIMSKYFELRGQGQWQN